MTTKKLVIFLKSHWEEIKQKQKWMLPGDRIRLALGTKETISETLALLSKKTV